MEITVVDIRFPSSTKKYYFSPNGIKLENGDRVIVETVKGLELAFVTSENHQVDSSEIVEELKTVVRIANENDFRRIEQSKIRAEEFKNETNKLIKKFNLDMKLVDVEVMLDGSKAFFSYVSEDRVDFRELVKEMASLFRIRIELKQIGSRDETKIVGGLGPCGRPCCCNYYLKDYANVSIKMAKTQGLSLNPQKINGLCGRLMCCLSFENKYYKEVSSVMPKLNAKIATKDGTGTVAYLNYLRKLITVKFIDENSNVKYQEYTLSDLGIKEVEINNQEDDDNEE